MSGGIILYPGDPSQQRYVTPTVSRRFSDERDYSITLHTDVKDKLIKRGVCGGRPWVQLRDTDVGEQTLVVKVVEPAERRTSASTDHAHARVRLPRGRHRPPARGHHPRLCQAQGGVWHR